MNEHKITPVMLEDLLLLWLKKNQPNETVYFIMASFLPEKIKETLHMLGLQHGNETPLFYAVPTKFESFIRIIKEDYGNRVCIISSDEL